MCSLEGIVCVWSQVIIGGGLEQVGAVCVVLRASLGVVLTVACLEGISDHDLESMIGCGCEGIM